MSFYWVSISKMKSDRSEGWHILRRPRSEVDCEKCIFFETWRSTIVIRSKYSFFHSSHIEADGRSAGPLLKCATTTRSQCPKVDNTWHATKKTEGFVA